MRLDFNENTVGCSPRILKRLKKLAAEDLTVYPDYEQALRKLAAYFGVSQDQIALTNGTDEAIQLVVNTYVREGETVVVLQPSYAMYRFYAQVMGAEVEEVSYGADLSFPGGELIRSITRRTRAVLLANPNNPTGSSATPAQLRALLRAARARRPSR